MAKSLSQTGDGQFGEGWLGGVEMMDKALPELVKNAVFELETDADIILYGSRARGDAGCDSDWDFLVLVNGYVDENRKRAIRHRLYEIEWATGSVISCIVESRQSWDQPITKITPFYKNVSEEGVYL